MDEQTVKTSLKQRIIIGAIAVFLLGSTMAIYIAITLGNDQVNYSKMTTKELEKAYSTAYETYSDKVADLSDQYADEFAAYKSQVKAYNAEAANSDGVQQKDLKEGDGDKLGETNSPSKYSAYYIGWCTDESIFDSSLSETTEDSENSDEENSESKTKISLKAPIPVEEGQLIEGWYLGTAGMKLGGIREITIPGALAYGDSTEICGSKNAPLKFIVYALPYQTELHATEERLSEIYQALSAAYANDYSNYSELNYDDYAEDESGTVEVSE